MSKRGKIKGSLDLRDPVYREALATARGAAAADPSGVIHPACNSVRRLREARLPMTEEPCPRCGGEGTVVVVDRERLRAERESRGLTQKDVAKAAGWTPSLVSMLESGARPLSEISAERYWNALHAAGRGQ